MDDPVPSASMQLDHTFVQLQSEEREYERIQRVKFSEAAREMFKDGEIDSDLGDWFTQIHRYLTHQPGGDPITVYLNTNGGDVQSMMMFIDVVRASRVPITIIGHGNVCSAGVLMLAWGHHRLVTHHCVMMVHQYAQDGESDGLRYAEAKERRKWEDWTHTRMIELMAEFSGKDVKYWKGVFEKKPEHWLLGGQAIVDEGLADSVVPWL